MVESIIQKKMKTNIQSDKQVRVEGQRLYFPDIKNNAKSIGKSRNQIAQKKVIKLPNIPKNKIPYPLQKEKNQTRSNKSTKKKAAFVLSMENKMKNVLAKINLKMPETGYNSSDSEDFDLEFKIKKNKQLMRNGYFQGCVRKEGEQNFNISNQPKVNFEKQISSNEKSQERPFSSRDISNDNVLIRERNQILYDKRPRSSKLAKICEEKEKHRQFDTHKDNNLISQNLNENIDIQYAEGRQFPQSIEKLQEKNLNEIKQDQNIPNKMKKKQINTTFVRNVSNQMKDVLKGLNQQMPEEGYGTYDTNDFNFLSVVKKNKEFLKKSNNKNKESQKNGLSEGRPISIGKSLNEKQNQNQNQYLVKSLKVQDKNNQNIIKKENSPNILSIPINKSKQVKINRKNLIPINNPSNLPKKSHSKSKIGLRSLSEKKMNEENLNIKPSLKLINRKDHIKQLEIEMKVRAPESQAIIEEVLEKRVKKLNEVKGLKTQEIRSAKKQLDQKLKQIEQQLKIINSDGVAEPKKQNDQNCEVRMRYSCRNWKKVKIQDQKIECQQGSFDGQLERIQQLQKRGQKIFGDYLQNRMMLMQLNIHNRQTKLMEDMYIGEEEKNDESS